MHPCLHRLSGPLREHVGGHQPSGRFLQSIVVTLGLRARILRAGRCGQGLQHRAEQRRTFRAEIAPENAGAVECRLQPHRPVFEMVVVAVLVWGVGGDLGGQPG